MNAGSNSLGIELACLPNITKACGDSPLRQCGAVVRLREQEESHSAAVVRRMLKYAPRGDDIALVDQSATLCHKRRLLQGSTRVRRQLHSPMLQVRCFIAAMVRCCAR